METFVLLLFVFFVTLVMLALVVYPGILLLGMAWSMLTGVRKGLSTHARTF